MLSACTLISSGSYSFGSCSSCLTLSGPVLDDGGVDFVADVVVDGDD